MIRHGHPPFLECSSQGDKRFSAFFARVSAYDGRSIEDIYQAAKRFPDGSTNLSWREAKGRRPVNSKYVARLYRKLWTLYIEENPTLLPILLAANGLSDTFGQQNHVCQATELWIIRCNSKKDKS